MQKTFIFDYDGLLVDSEKLALKAETQMLSEFGYSLTEEGFGKYLGVPVRDVMEAYIKDFGLQADVQDMVDRRAALINDLLDTLELMPGAPELLAYLKKNDWTLAIASSGKRDYILKGLRKFELESFFQEIVTVDDVARGKPHPDLVLETLKRTQVAAHEAMMAEDAPNGIAAANAAGVFSIAVPAIGQSWADFHAASAVFRDLHRVLNFLKIIHNDR